MPTNVEDRPEFKVARRKPSPGRGFTLIELLVVLAVIALLIALLIPASRSARPAARRAQCVNNLKQIALALYNYEQTYKVLPPAYTVDASGKPLHSWRTLILPYLEREPLYRTIDLSKPWNDPANARAFETSLAEFRCPEAAGPANNTTTYLAVVGPDACFLPRESRRLAEITDARGSTLMVIEAGVGKAVPWMAPVDADESLVMSLVPTAKLPHSGGMNACMVNGSVRFFKASTPAKVRRALVSIAGNDDGITTEW